MCVGDGIDKFAYHLSRLPWCRLQQEMRRVDFDDFHSGLDAFDQVDCCSRDHGVFACAQVKNGYVYGG